MAKKINEGEYALQESLKELKEIIRANLIEVKIVFINGEPKIKFIKRRR